MNNICKICNREVKENSHYWKNHKMKEKDYYVKFFPRFDLFDNSPILFKNKDQYLNADFNSKDNLNKWLKISDKDTIKKYITNWFKNRKEKKDLVYTPSQVELRSLIIPGINYIHNLFGDYYEFCNSLGFINKLQSFDKLKTPIKLDGRRIIWVDSREQYPLVFETITPKIKKLDYGDYMFANNEWTGKISIERKSLSDFLGTLSSGYERFKRELKRAQDDNAYVIILVEETLERSLDYKNLGLLNYRVNISPDYIFHRVRELNQEFKDIQFLFVNSHNAAAIMVEKLFSYGAQIKNYDLQLLLDKGIL
jgi:hypothetical protein